MVRESYVEKSLFRMRRWVALRGLAPNSVSTYVRCARQFLAHIDIEDTGPGLTADELAQIFEPFARGNSASHTAPGAGLGLTIAKMLTDLMGGEMTVASTPGAGSVFRIKLFLPESSEVVG